MPCLLAFLKTKRQGSCVFLPPWKRTLWQHLPPCISCPSRDLRHSTSNPKQRREQVRLNNGGERREHERDYAPWDEARVTVSWIGVRGFVVVVGLGKGAMHGLLQEMKCHGWGKWGTLESKVSMAESVSWCKGHVNVQHWNPHTVKTVTRAVTRGEVIMFLYRFKHNKRWQGATTCACACLLQRAHVYIFACSQPDVWLHLLDALVWNGLDW